VTRWIHDDRYRWTTLSYDLLRHRGDLQRCIDEVLLPELAGLGVVGRQSIGRIVTDSDGHQLGAVYGTLTYAPYLTAGSAAVSTVSVTNG
jgi:hypothetical protein